MVSCLYGGFSDVSRNVKAKEIAFRDRLVHLIREENQLMAGIAVTIQLGA